MTTPTLNMRPLTSALQQKAIAELNEVPESLALDIAAFRERCLNEPHLKCRTSDQFLVSFMRNCKFSLEKAKRKYYTLRTAMSDLKQHSFVNDQRLRASIHLGSKCTPRLSPFCEAVPIKYLPKECGGENSGIEAIVAKTEQLILEYCEYLLEERNYDVGEKLRVGGDSFYTTAVHGLKGSFRKLDVD